MARSPAEIEAEIESRKSAGEHHATSKMRELRAELEAVSGQSEAPSPQDGPPPMPRVDAPEAASPGGGDVFDTDEWRFTEKVIADLTVPQSTASPLKMIYNEVKRKVQVYRMIREVVLERGAGAPWPQFVALDRDPSTGERLSEKRARVEAEQARIAAEQAANAGDEPQPTVAAPAVPQMSPPGAETAEGFAAAVAAGVAESIAAGGGPPSAP